jgi:nitrogen fixation protein NifU and related proteins
VSLDLAALYRDVIVEHANHPRNRRVIEHDAVSAEGVNPLCGDEVTVYLRLDGNVIADVSFEAQGCAISTASASLMTEALIGKTLSEALDLFEGVRAMLTTTTRSSTEADRVGKLSALSGISAYPMRVKCATLAWHTFREALEASGATLTTESAS